MTKASTSKGAARRRSAPSAIQAHKAVSQLGLAMASKLSLDAVFREFVSGVKKYVPHDRLMIARTDPQGRVTGLFLVSSHPHDSLDTDPELSHRGNTATNWALRQRKVLVREDTATGQEFEADAHLKRMGFRSYVCLPLICWDRVVGALHCASNRARAFGKRESSFLEAAAEWLAIAMENARFFQQTHRLLEEQGVLHQITSEINMLDLDALLKRLTGEILTIFKADCAFVRLRDADGAYRIRALSGADLPPYHETNLENQIDTTRLIRDCRPRVIRDLRELRSQKPKRTVLEPPGFRSYLGVPIVLKEEGIGALVVLSRTLKNFTDRDVFFLQQLAAEAAVAISHALLFEELRRLNDDLERANWESSQFLARLAHELKTPLTIIIGLLEVMHMGSAGSLTEQQKSALGKIQDQSDALLRMLNDLLNFSRIKSGPIPLQIGPVPIAEILKSLQPLLEELKRKRDLAVVWDIEPDFPTLVTDGLKLEAILNNLIVNAFKYTTRGEVRIRFKNRPVTGTVELIVEDTGQGITEDELARIFDGYHQVRATDSTQGVGLGLTIVKKYVEILQGTIEVKSEPGKGSAFKVVLPQTLEARQS